MQYSMQPMASATGDWAVRSRAWVLASALGLTHLMFVARTKTPLPSTEKAV